MQGGTGADWLAGGNGNDTLDGGADDDWLTGFYGADSLAGGAGNDTLRGDPGTDRLEGGDGWDSLDGGDDADTLLGGNEDDTLLGQAGNDRLMGNAGQDRMLGGDDNDQLLGGAGGDTLGGDAGYDSLSGGLGADSLRGGTGDDLLLSRSDAGEPARADGGALALPAFTGGSSDILRGDAGADIFRFDLLLNALSTTAANYADSAGRVNWAALAAGESQATHARWLDGIGNDSIMDFAGSAGDVIQIRGFGVTVSGIAYRDVNGDRVAESIISLRAGAGGDELGSITVYGERVTAAMLQVDATAALGAYATVGQPNYVQEEAWSVFIA